MIGGVAGGLARYFEIDPVFFRVGFTVAAFLGFGLIAYLALYIFVPLDDGWGNPVPADSRSRLLAAGAAVILLIALPGGLIPFSGFDWWWGLWGFMFWIAILAGAAYIIYRLLRPGAGREMTAGRLLGLILLTFLVSGVAGALAITSAWATAAGGSVVIAILVIATGLMLALAAFLRPARWLVIPALALVLPLAAVEAAGIEIEGGYGDRYVHPVAAQTIPGDGYRQAVGDLTVDLRDLEWEDDTVVDLPLRMGVGRASVIVPKSVCVTADAEAKAGRIDVRGQSDAGLAVELVSSTVPNSGPTLNLDGRIEIGLLEVITHDPDAYRGRDHFGPWGEGHDRDSASRAESRQPARCFTGSDGSRRAGADANTGPDEGGGKRRAVASIADQGGAGQR